MDSAAMPMQRVARRDWITKAEFHSRLRRWFRETDESVIGDPHAHALTAWVWIRDGHRLARLNADTTRAAVAQYLDLLRAAPGELEWSVVPSTRGHLTKIAFGPEHTVLSSFHLYADPSTVPARLLDRDSG
jgi:hypothetical protein